MTISCNVSFRNHVIDTKIDHFHPEELLSVNRLCLQCYTREQGVIELQKQLCSSDSNVHWQQQITENVDDFTRRRLILFNLIFPVFLAIHANITKKIK